MFHFDCSSSIRAAAVASSLSQRCAVILPHLPACDGGSFSVLVCIALPCPAAELAPVARMVSAVMPFVLHKVLWQLQWFSEGLPASEAHTTSILSIIFISLSAVAERDAQGSWSCLAVQHGQGHGKHKNLLCSHLGIVIRAHLPAAAPNLPTPWGLCVPGAELRVWTWARACKPVQKWLSNFKNKLTKNRILYWLLSLYLLHVPAKKTSSIKMLRRM